MLRIAHLLGMIPLCASALAAQGPTATLSGTVRDGFGNPIREAVVVIDPDSASLRTRTTADGRFRIDSVRLGQHALVVARIGFRPHRASVDVPTLGLDVAVVMDAVPVVLDTISVRVARTGIHGVVTTRGISLLPHEPRPLRGAIVEVLDRPYRTTTGRDGSFRIDNIGEGSYSLLVRLDRYQSRIVPVLVPETGGLDVTVVLDSTIADWQRREDYQFRSISQRLREASNPAAFVSAAELVGPAELTLKDALRVAPSTLSRGLVTKDEVTCVYIEGQPRPGMTTADILADEVHAVEVYGITGRGTTSAPPVPWLLGTFCGTGTKQGPYWRASAGDGPRGYAVAREPIDNVARVVVVWLKRRR
jgi:hypothetical protein